MFAHHSLSHSINTISSTRIQRADKHRSPYAPDPVRPRSPHMHTHMHWSVATETGNILPPLPPLPHPPGMEGTASRTQYRIPGIKTPHGSSHTSHTTSGRCFWISCCSWHRCPTMCQRILLPTPPASSAPLSPLHCFPLRPSSASPTLPTPLNPLLPLLLLLLPSVQSGRRMWKSCATGAAT
jgi:hypothetical protein